jgi:hypothetical protein
LVWCQLLDNKNSEFCNEAAMKQFLQVLVTTIYYVNTITRAAAPARCWEALY